MKYIITESKVLSILEKYLNDIKWGIINYDEWEMTRLFFKDQMQFPEDAIFESYTDESDGEYPDQRVLLVRDEFFDKLSSLFSLTPGELSIFLTKWYNDYTGEKIDTVDFMS